MIRHRGAAGILFMSIIIAFATTMSYFGYRYYNAHTSQTVREMTYKQGILAVRDAMNAYKDATFRRYSSRAGTSEELGHYYAFFPEDLTHLVTEGFLNLDDSGLKMVVVNNRNMIVDKYNRPILYFRSSLARRPFETQNFLKTNRACQFEYIITKNGNIITDVDVRVPSVLIVFPGGRSMNDPTQEADTEVSYNRLYSNLTNNDWLREENAHWSMYNTLVNNNSVGYSVQRIRERASNKQIAEMDELLVFDAVNEYVSLEREVSTNMASIADNFVSQWRMVYAKKLAEVSKIAQIPPDQYLILASTRSKSNNNSREWPTEMLKSLCYDVNNEVFGLSKDSIVLGYKKYNFINTASPTSDIILNNFPLNSAIKTTLDPLSPKSKFLNDFSYDERFLTVQRISSLSRDHIPGLTLEFSCKCRLQNEQAVDCKEIGLKETMYDDRDLFIREMFLEVSNVYQKSECPVYRED